MFFDESTPKKPNLKPRLRLADEADVRALDNRTARERLEFARYQREGAPSLLDRIDAMTQVNEEARRQALDQEEQTRKAKIEEEARYARATREDAPQPVQQREPRLYGDEPNAYPTFQNDQWPEHRDNAAPLINPIYVINSIRKWRGLIAATTILGGLVGVGLALTTPKIYYSSTSILIDPRNYKVVANDINPDVFLSEASLAIVDTQLNIIRSPAVLDQVVAERKLDKVPEFNGTSVGLLSKVTSFLNIVSGENSATAKTSSAIKNLNRLSEAKRQTGTFIINIGAFSQDPQLAADIANTTVDVYLAQRNTDRIDTADKTSGDIASRLPELKKQVEESETKVSRFKSENDLFDAQGRLIDDEAILRLNEQLSAARSTTISLNSRADSAKSITVDGLVAGGLPEEISSNVLSTLRGQYTGAKQRYDGLQSKLGPKHPDLQQSANEAASLKASIESEIKRIRTAIQTDLRRAVQTEQSLAASLATMKAKLAKAGDAFVTLRELEREAGSSRTVYEQFLLRSQETSEQGSIDSTNVKRIGLAKPSGDPAGTSRKLIAIGGTLGGFALGFGIAMLLGILDALKNQYRAPTPPAPTRKPNPTRGMFAAEAPLGRLLPTRAAANISSHPNAQVQEQVQEALTPEPSVAAVPAPARAPSIAAPAPAAPQAQPPLEVPIYPQAQAPVMPMMQNPMLMQQAMMQQAMMPQFMMPQMMMPQAMMPHMMMQPQPVWMQQPFVQPQPLTQPVTQPTPAVRAPEPVAGQPHGITLKPIEVGHVTTPRPPKPDLHDIQQSLDSMRAELLSLAKMRKQA